MMAEADDDEDEEEEEKPTRTKKMQRKKKKAQNKNDDEDEGIVQEEEEELDTISTTVADMVRSKKENRPTPRKKAKQEVEEIDLPPTSPIPGKKRTAVKGQAKPKPASVPASESAFRGSRIRHAQPVEPPDDTVMAPGTPPVPPPQNLYEEHGKRKAKDKQAKIRPSELPSIDLEKEERVFAVLDEGCNSTCHTTAWYKHAKKIMKKNGKPISDLSGPEKKFRGVGKTTSKCKRVVPWGITPCEGLYIEGQIKSGEIETMSSSTCCCRFTLRRPWDLSRM